MRYRSARRIRPELELLDRRDVPSSFIGNAAGEGGSAAVALVAPVPTKITYAAIGTLSSTLSPGEIYQAVAVVTETTHGSFTSFTANVQVIEREYHTVEHYSVTGTIDPISGAFSGSGSGTDGDLAISGYETIQGTQRVLTVTNWTVTDPTTGSVFDSGTGKLAAPPIPS